MFKKTLSIYDRIIKPEQYSRTDALLLFFNEDGELFGS